MPLRGLAGTVLAVAVAVAVAVVPETVTEAGADFVANIGGFLGAGLMLEEKEDAEEIEKALMAVPLVVVVVAVAVLLADGEGEEDCAGVGDLGVSR